MMRTSSLSDSDKGETLWLFRHFLFIFLTLFTACGNGEEGKTKEQGEKGSAGKSSIDSVSKRVKGLNKQIQEDPQNARLYYQRAGAFDDMGRTDKAMDDMERALDVDSTQSDFHDRIAGLYFQKGKAKKAKDHYRRAVALDGDNTKALIGMAELFMATRQNQQAINYANEALKVDEHLPRPYTIKGLIHQRTKDTAKAISSFQTTVELDPENHSAFLQLGFLMAAKDREIALDYYNTASRIEPDDPRPLYNKGLYLQNHGRPDDAIRTYEELIEVDTGFVEAYYNIGYIHLVLKDSARKALDWFNKALNFKPKYYQALYNRGFCYEKLDQRDSAIRNYRKALRFKKNYRPAAKGLQRLDAPYNPNGEGSV